MSEVTRILSAIEEGDPHAAEQLLPLVYDELRRLAAQKRAQERPGQTLQPTALVHEGYLRLVENNCRSWDSRHHFFAAAAEAMRRIPSAGPPTQLDESEQPPDAISGISVNPRGREFAASSLPARS